MDRLVASFPPPISQMYDNKLLMRDSCFFYLIFSPADLIEDLFR